MRQVQAGDSVSELINKGAFVARQGKDELEPMVQGNSVGANSAFVGRYVSAPDSDADIEYIEPKSEVVWRNSSLQDEIFHILTTDPRLNLVEMNEIQDLVETCEVRLKSIVSPILKAHKRASFIDSQLEHQCKEIINQAVVEYLDRIEKEKSK